MSVTSKQILQATGFKSPKNADAVGQVRDHPWTTRWNSSLGKRQDCLLARLGVGAMPAHRRASAASVTHLARRFPSLRTNARFLRLLDEIEKSPHFGELHSKKSNSERAGNQS